MAQALHSRLASVDCYRHPCLLCSCSGVSRRVLTGAVLVRSAACACFVLKILANGNRYVDTLFRRSEFLAHRCCVQSLSGKDAWRNLWESVWHRGTRVGPGDADGGGLKGLAAETGRTPGDPATARVQRRGTAVCRRRVAAPCWECRRQLSAGGLSAGACQLGPVSCEEGGRQLCLTCSAFPCDLRLVQGTCGLALHTVVRCTRLRSLMSRNSRVLHRAEALPNFGPVIMHGQFGSCTIGWWFSVPFATGRWV